MSSTFLSSFNFITLICDFMTIDPIEARVWEDLLPLKKLVVPKNKNIYVNNYNIKKDNTSYMLIGPKH